MKTVRQKINKIFLAGAALSLAIGFLFAPYFFVDAGFFDKAIDASGEDFGCDNNTESNYTYAGDNYCVSGCTDNADCGAGEMCVVTKGNKSVNLANKTTHYKATGECVTISSEPALCLTDADCKAKSKGDSCAALKPPEWKDNIFVDAICAKGATEPVGCCTTLSDGTSVDKTYVECLAFGGDDPASISWQAGTCSKPTAGPTAGACKSDKDCLNNLICGGIDAAGNGKCIATGSVAAGGTCKKDEECKAGVCGQKDAKTGIGYCTVEGGLIGGFAEFTKESCEKNGGEWVAGAGADEKGECYAKGAPIDLSTEIGGKKQVKSIGDYLMTVFNVAMAFGAGFAALMVMLGGFLYMTSGGDPNKTTVAKQYGIAAVTGLVLILFSYMLFNTINPALIRMKPIAMPMVPPGGLACCKQGISLKMASTAKCESGWTEVPFAQCQTGMTLGGPCCVTQGEPGNSKDCHAIGGTCIHTQKFDSVSPCAKVLIAAGVVSVGIIGGAAAGATAVVTFIARAGWTVLKWVGEKVLQVTSLCFLNLGTCLTIATGVGAGIAISELLELDSCADENAGVCVEPAGPLLNNGDMCGNDSQCASQKCCLIIEGTTCWNLSAIGFCSNGKSGPVSEMGVGTCKLEGSAQSCCEAVDAAGNKVSCAGAQVGSTMLGYCSAGLEGHACAKYTGGNFLTGYTYDINTNTCKTGLKCNDKGVCTLESGKSGATVKCDEDSDCTDAQFCAEGKHFCKTDKNGGATAIPDSEDFEGCIKGTVSDELTCYNKFVAAHGCKDKNQCQSNKCENFECSEGTGAGESESCSETADCSSGLVCVNDKCTAKNKAGGTACTGNEECEFGFCAGNNICSYGSQDSLCDNDKNCESGLKCVGDKCSAGAAAGESCNSDAECLSKNCNTGAMPDECGPSDNGVDCDKDKDCKSQICNVELSPDECVAAGSGKTGDDCDRNEICASGICDVSLLDVAGVTSPICK